MQSETRKPAENQAESLNLLMEQMVQKMDKHDETLAEIKSTLQVINKKLD